MTDTIASRVTRVIGSSVHALLDAVENAAPEAAMAQAIREVDQAIDEVRAELGRVEAVKHLATSSLNKLNTQNEGLAGQVEIAVAKGDEGLARAGIAKQVDIEDQIPVLQRSLHDALDRSKELEGYIAALLAKKREMDSALQDFVAAHAAASSSTGRRFIERAYARKGRARRIGLRPRARAPDRHHRRHVCAQPRGIQVAGAARARSHAPDRRAPGGPESRAG